VIERRYLRYAHLLPRDEEAHQGSGANLNWPLTAQFSRVTRWPQPREYSVLEEVIKHIVCLALEAGTRGDTAQRNSVVTRNEATRYPRCISDNLIDAKLSQPEH